MTKNVWCPALILSLIEPGKINWARVYSAEYLFQCKFKNASAFFGIALGSRACAINRGQAVFSKLKLD